MTAKRKIAILVEIPIGLDNAGMAALRRFLKALIRSYGIKCLAVKNPIDTKTFSTACLHPNEPMQPSTTPVRDVRC